MQDHAKFEIAKNEYKANHPDEEVKAAAPRIEEEKKDGSGKNDPLAKYRAGEDRYTELMENLK